MERNGRRGLKGLLPITLALAGQRGAVPAPCPCGSGIAEHACCLRADGTWVPPRIAIRRTTGRTGRVVTGCYAAALSDCDGRLSREHYVADAVLRMVASQPVMAGFRGGRSIVGAANMVAKVLCQRHNEMLSPLDGLAKRWVEALRAFFPGMHRSTHRPGDGRVLFHGDDIGRVLLKTLCAISAGRVPVGDHLPPPAWTPPESWLRILFDDAAWPEGWGLHVPVLRRGSDSSGVGFTLSRRVDQENRTVGLDFGVATLPFILLMDTAPPSGDWGDEGFQIVVPQPSRVVVAMPGVTKTIEFGWATSRNGGTVTHRISSMRAHPVLALMRGDAAPKLPLPSSARP